MKQVLSTPQRATGSLLVASLLVLLLALVILIASGALPGFSASLQGSLERMAPYAATFRLLNLLWTVGWIVQLLGFGLFARLLWRAGGEQPAVLAFSLILVAAILGILHGTFHMAVETQAAQEAARGGGASEVYEALRTWVGGFFRVAYVVHLVGQAAFGWAVLRARLLKPWVGWACIGWSIFWLGGYLAGAGAPGLLFLMPAALGVALLRE